MIKILTKLEGLTEIANSYPKIQEPILTDSEKYRFLHAGFYCTKELTFFEAPCALKYSKQFPIDRHFGMKQKERLLTNTRLMTE